MTHVVRVVALDALLQFGQPAGRGGSDLWIGIARVRVFRSRLGRHLVIRQRLSEVVEAALLLVRVAQHAELDLQRGHALAPHIRLEPGLLDRGLHPLLRRHPPVSVAQQHDLEGPAPLDLAQTHLEHEQLLSHLVIQVHRLHAPPQVDGLQVMSPLPQSLLQLREHLATQHVPLGLHVAEGAGDEDRTSLPDWSNRHGCILGTGGAVRCG